MKPLVSIVIPSFNHGAYLRDAVTSALGQSLKEIEVIVVDDASSDDSLQILASIQDERLKIFINPENLGSSLTLNRGIEASSAPIIAALNSDDLFDPERLSRCLSVFENPDIVLVSTDLRLIDSEGAIIHDPDFWWLKWYSGLVSEFLNSNDMAATLFSGNIFVSTSNMIFRKSLIDKIGPFSVLRYTQDYEFALRAVRAFPAGVIRLEDQLVSYRLHHFNTILEDRVPPVLETLTLLARELPKFESPLSLSRLQANYEAHLSRLFQYLKEGAEERADQINATRIRAMQDCIDGMESHIRDQDRHLLEMQKVIDSQASALGEMQVVIDAQQSFLEKSVLQRGLFELRIGKFQFKLPVEVKDGPRGGSH